MFMWTFLKSRKLAVYLSLFFLIFLIAMVFIPQEGRVSQVELARFKEAGWMARFLFAAGFTHLASSTWFFAFIALFFLNTLACFTVQVKAVYQRSKKEIPFPRSLEKMTGYQSLEGRSFDREELIALLWERRYRLRIEDKKGETRIAGRKGRTHYFGKLVFHFGLMVVFLGLSLTALFRFSGAIELTEGEIAGEGKGAFFGHNRPMVFTGYPPFSLTLVRFRPTRYSNGDFKTVASTIRLASVQEVLEKRLATSFPFSYSGYRIYQLAEGGASAYLVLIDKNSVMLDSAFVRFYRTASPKGPLEGSHRFTGNDVSIKGTLYPSAKVEKGKISLVSYRLDRPLLDITVKKKGKVERFKLRPRELAKFDDYSIYFEEARYWTRFQIVYDPGTWFSFTGFGLGLVGLIAIYLFTEQHIFVKVEKAGRSRIKVHLAGRAVNRREEMKDLILIRQSLEDWMGVNRS